MLGTQKTQSHQSYVFTAHSDKLTETIFTQFVYQMYTHLRRHRTPLAQFLCSNHIHSFPTNAFRITQHQNDMFPLCIRRTFVRPSFHQPFTPQDMWICLKTHIYLLQCVIWSGCCTHPGIPSGQRKCVLGLCEFSMCVRSGSQRRFPADGFHEPTMRNYGWGLFRNEYCILFCVLLRCGVDERWVSELEKICFQMIFGYKDTDMEMKIVGWGLDRLHRMRLNSCKILDKQKEGMKVQDSVCLCVDSSNTERKIKS